MPNGNKKAPFSLLKAEKDDSKLPQSPEKDATMI